jgi:two-component system alkaline phosphatase synthesis response regulator PhoP
MSTKIFLAEDDPLMSRMYERAFKATGYELELASDGEEAVSKLEKIEVIPTIILLDVMMPKKNGFDVLRQVKSNDKLKHVPVIMLTNLAGDADATKALELGAVLYLVKSQYSPKEVIGKVQEILSASSRNEEVLSVSVGVKDIESDKK